MTLLEAMVSLGLVAVSALVISGSVMSAMHATSVAIAHESLVGVAQNVLADLRDASAYQPAVLDQIANNGTLRYDLAQPNGAGSQNVHVTESVQAQKPRPGMYVAVVIVTASDGTQATLQSYLVQQAPVPGSIVTPDPGATPAPAPQSTGGSSGSGGTGGGSGTGNCAQGLCPKAPPMTLN